MGSGDERTARRLEALLAEARSYQVDESPLVGEPVPFVPGDDPWNAFVLRLPEPSEAPPDGPLYNLRFAVKDLYDVAGLPTRAGSRVLAGRPPAARDAEVVRKLRAAGAVLVGKTATHEFAYGCTTDGTRNPLDPTRSPGGSSGGSAAAVAAGLVPVAMGTDTGGSVRIPAACCGVVGFKPSYGLYGSEGVLPLAWTLDHPGTLAATVADAVRVHRVLAPTSAVLRKAPSRIGIPAAWLETPMDPAVRQAFVDQVKPLNPQPVELPPLALFHFVSRVITLAEAGAYHSAHLDRLADYGPDVRARVELGQVIPAREYIQAQRLRAELGRRMAEVMEQVDILVTPTIPIPAPELGQRVWTYPDGRKEPVAEALLRFTGPFNVTGQPAITLPSGFHLVGRVGEDEALLAFAGLLCG